MRLAKIMVAKGISFGHPSNMKTAEVSGKENIKASVVLLLDVSLTVIIAQMLL